MDVADKNALFEQIQVCGRYMHHAHHHMRHQERRGVKLYDSQSRLLRLLYAQDGLSHKQIAQSLGVTPASAGELVKKLETRGYISRRFSQSDKRISNVFITQEGRAVAALSEQNQDPMLEEIFAALNEEEMTTLSTLIERLNASLAPKYGWHARRGLEHDHRGPHDHFHLEKAEEHPRT